MAKRNINNVKLPYLSAPINPIILPSLNRLDLETGLYPIAGNPEGMPSQLTNVSGSYLQVYRHSEGVVIQEIIFWWNTWRFIRSYLADHWGDWKMYQYTI